MDICYNKDDILSITSRHELFDISFYKSKEQLQSIESFSTFVKACCSLVRHSSEYNQYKSQLMFDLGLNRCQILGNVEADEDGQVEVEMHHGPILTLFDYCAIVTDYLLNKNEKLTTFRVAKIVLNEHFEGNVQTVMLSVTPHNLVDTGEMFINFSQAFGNLNKFLTKYRDGLNDERIQKINRYIELSEEYDSFDNGLLDIKNTITNWDYEIAKNRAKDNKGDK